MSNRFEQKVAEFIKVNKLSRSKSKLLLAVSGGADSIALLYVMNSLIHHQLRDKEADKDEQFVISKCEELGVPIETKRIDVLEYAAEKKISIETAARQLRISCLIDIAKVHKCDYIATGHQKDDNAETVLQQCRDRIAAIRTRYRLSGLGRNLAFERIRKRFLLYKSPAQYETK
ncbi:MAG: tRNA lysidine(34) synthetase [Planctomycetota bacterium]|jgi:tRNA(Ile)-lysidine synthase